MRPSKTTIVMRKPQIALNCSSFIALAGAGRACLERAADPLHRARINPKPLGDLAHAWPSRSRQSLPDSLFQLGGYPRTPQPFSLTPGPR
jgi:hypothetical protein